MSGTDKRPLVAVDAMGGDFGPAVVVPGAVAALRGGVACDIAFYGDAEAIRQQLREAKAEDLPVEIVSCSQDIAMGEAPAAAVRNRPDSPIVKAMRDHREGRVQAVVSAGSTGAMVAASLIILGRVEGVDRPAIATFIPTVAGETLLVDGGANVAATPALLVSFARMGAVHFRVRIGTERPRVGLLNIGEEPGKGSELTVAAHALLREAGLNFAGNVEGNDLLIGSCDVLVTDGFTGNIVLKLAEGFSQFLQALGASGQLSDDELAALRALGAVMHRRYSYEVYGGAPLLGVAGVAMICHGRSTERAFAQAVRAAAQEARADLPGQLARAFAALS